MAQHGVTSNSYERVVMGPGQVKIGASVIVATKGGNVLEINRIFRDIRPDGAKGKVKGFRYLESAEAILTVNLMEITEQNLVYALAGSSVYVHGITGGEIAMATYISSVSLLCEVKGVTPATEMTLITIKLDNCLVEGPMTLTLPESGEVVLQLKFNAHYLATDLATEPWSITFTPK